MGSKILVEYFGVSKLEVCGCFQVYRLTSFCLKQCHLGDEGSNGISNTVCL